MRQQIAQAKKVYRPSPSWLLPQIQNGSSCETKGGLCIPPGVKHARFQVINGFQHGGHAEFCPIFDLIFSPGKAVMVSQTF